MHLYDPAVCASLNVVLGTDLHPQVPGMVWHLDSQKGISHSRGGGDGRNKWWGCAYDRRSDDGGSGCGTADSIGVS